MDDHRLRAPARDNARSRRLRKSVCAFDFWSQTQARLANRNLRPLSWLWPRFLSPRPSARNYEETKLIFGGERMTSVNENADTGINLNKEKGSSDSEGLGCY